MSIYFSTMPTSRNVLMLINYTEYYDKKCLVYSSGIINISLSFPARGKVQGKYFFPLYDSVENQ